MFTKETLDVIKTEVKRIKEQVISLLPTKISIHDREVSVKPTLIFCMIAGKICKLDLNQHRLITCAVPSLVNFRKRHKRKFKELFTRKTSRINTNKDLINRLLLTSDPFIANLHARPKTKRGKISNEVRELLEIRTPAPIEQDAILSDYSDTEESESDLEESDLDSE
ncbi:hypothetical protein AVEN_14784-1 [Araneus ventricosus]|uniref:Uncharacterized protein n=1 Tax=Araneus ventricosus TaxID=182803 RepID=A0A4Y2BAU7_ARAVE|nr:hypothetical protein AVEN_79718-1 [Araneus ventricosus]GBL88710.1 hypothetical protein AVEN_14784-1 [Araneus ventricosus]